MTGAVEGTNKKMSCNTLLDYGKVRKIAALDSVVFRGVPMSKKPTLPSFPDWEENVESGSESDSEEEEYRMVQLLQQLQASKAEMRAQKKKELQESLIAEAFQAFKLEAEEEISMIKRDLTTEAASDSKDLARIQRSIDEIVAKIDHLESTKRKIATMSKALLADIDRKFSELTHNCDKVAREDMKEVEADLSECEKQIRQRVSQMEAKIKSINRTKDDDRISLILHEIREGQTC